MSLFRKIILIVVAVGFLVILALSYRYFMRVNAPVGNALEAVPPSAGLVLKTDELPELWSRVSETNMIWENLIKTTTFKGLDTTLKSLDSLYHSNEELEKVIDGNTVYVSLHMSGAGTFSVQFSVGLPGSIKEKKARDMMNELTGNAGNWEKRSYDGTDIFEFTKDGGTDFSYAIENGILMVSPSSILVEDALRHIHSGTSLNENKSFDKVQKTMGVDVDANVLINYEHFGEIVSTFLHEDDKVASSLDLAKWSGMDLLLKPNSLILTGFTDAGGSLENFLEVFRDQEPQDIELPFILPSHTSFLYYNGFSNFNTYEKNYSEYLKKHNEKFDRDKMLESFRDSCDCKIEELGRSWIGDEVGVAVMEPRSEDDLIDRTILTVGAIDIEQAGMNLEKIRSAFKSGKEMEEEKDEDEEDGPEYAGVKIHRLPTKGLFHYLLGQAYPKLNKPYYITIEDYVVLSQSKGALRDLINDHRTGRTLARNINFDSFSENLSGEANLFIYSSIGRSPFLYKKFLNEDLAPLVDENVDLFRKFQSFGIQFLTSEDGLYYNNIYLEYDPVYKKETASLWELPLDTSISSKPHLVTNHYTEAQEVFVQDDSNKVYLISNTGEILWKKELSETITSKVYQIDIYKNEKLQMLFATETRIHVLDRKGRYVEGFPVELPERISAPLALFDYAGTRDYRIVAACRDNKLHFYNKHGEVVEGWSFEGTEGPIVRQPQHIRINTRDYILVTDSLGNVRLLNRRGDDRYPVEETISPSMNTPIVVNEEKDIASSFMVFTDTTGTIIKQRFNGKKVKVDLWDAEMGHFFDHKDLDLDGRREYILVDGNVLTVNGPDESEMFSFEFDSTITDPPQYYHFPDQKGKLGVVDRKASKAFLFDHTGSLGDGMPLFGNTRFSIGDMNKDGVFELVIGAEDGNIYTYSL